MRRTFFGALALATVALTVVFVGSALAKPGGGGTSSSTCPNGTAGATLDTNLTASFTTSGTTTTYTFSGTESGVTLIGYCVYPPSTNIIKPGNVTALFDSWVANTSRKAPYNFSFVRPTGGPGVPADGTSHDIGRADWTTVPTSQTFLLHITGGVCGTGNTCFVLPNLGPVCNAGTGDTTAAYNNIPFGAVDCGPPSHAFEATQTKEFGNEVVLAKGGDLGSLKVLFNSYACEDSPQWNNQYCATTVPGDNFTHPITANIYAANPDHTVGALLATVTVTQTIPYRPSADTVKCGTTGAWFNTVSGNCEFSAKVVLPFTGWTKTADYPASGFTVGDHVIWTVEFATSTNGLTPTDSSQCTVNAGCPYDSLNVGTKTFPGAPYAGTEADTHAAFINSTWNGIYCDDGVGGTGFLRVSTNPPTPCTNTEAVNNYAADAWLGLTPLATITLS